MLPGQIRPLVARSSKGHRNIPLQGVKQLAWLATLSMCREPGWSDSKLCSENYRGEDVRLRKSASWREEHIFNLQTGSKEGYRAAFGNKTRKKWTSWWTDWHFPLLQASTYRIFRPISFTFFPPKKLGENPVRPIRWKLASGGRRVVKKIHLPGQRLQRRLHPPVTSYTPLQTVNKAAAIRDSADITALFHLGQWHQQFPQAPPPCLQSAAASRKWQEDAHAAADKQAEDAGKVIEFSLQRHYPPSPPNYQNCPTP